MIDGDVNMFVEDMHYGAELAFLYRGRTLFMQGYYENGIYTLCLTQWNPPIKENYLWHKKGKDMSELAEDFLKEPFFDGKTFWEVEQELTWVDG